MTREALERAAALYALSPEGRGQGEGFKPHGLAIPPSADKNAPHPDPLPWGEGERDGARVFVLQSVAQAHAR